MKMINFKKKICMFTVLFAAILMCIPNNTITVHAKIAAESTTEGVMQVNSVYTDDDGVSHIIVGGAGFLIGSEDDGEYVVTNYSTVSPDSDTKYAAYEYLGISNENDEWKNINLTTEVVVQNDVVVDATIVASSKSMDLAILSLSQPIYTSTPLTILTSDDESDVVSVTDAVYSLGFPTQIIYKSHEVYYSNDKVTMSAGAVTNLVTIDDVKYIQHDCEVAENNAGGPLVNEDGYVIGMNVLDSSDNYYYAVDSSMITDVLDGLGISYDKESISDLDIEADSATLETSSSVQVVEEKGITISLISVIIVLSILAVIALVVTLIVMVIMRLISNKKNKNDKNDEKMSADKPRYDGERYNDSSASMQTSVLGRGNCAETSILGSAARPNANANFGTLIRKKSGENIQINKQLFVIGKDPNHSDYCIKDNPAISRKHAIIRVDGMQVYIEDCHSTNGTFVNGQKIVEGQKQFLTNTNKIKLGDEEFIYRIG